MKTPNKMIGGIAGAMAQQGGAINQTFAQPMPLQQFPNTPPPSSLVSPFAPQTQATMAGAYGGAQMPGTAFRMESDSPLEGNAFIGALEAAKADGAKSFNLNGKTYPVK